MNQMNYVFGIILSALQELRDLDWNSLQFKKESFASGAAILLGAALLLKIFWPWIRKHHKDRSFLEHSGYGVSPDAKLGIVSNILLAFPLVIAVMASVFVLIAMADPYFVQSDQVKIQESREIIYLRDTSASMGLKMGDRPRGEILQEFLLELIAGRKNQNDRAAYIIFASEPRIYADFTTSNSSLLFSVATGPIVTADASAPKNFPGGLFALKEFEVIPFEGGTETGLGLEAVMELFEKKGDKKIGAEMKRNPSIKKRSVIILTDGGSDHNPEPQFKELEKRRIVPYLIFIDPDREAEKKIVEGRGGDLAELKLPELLLSQVRQYGGQYFLAKDVASMDRIRKKLDELQTSATGIKTYAVEAHIYRPFLVVAILLYTIAIFLRLAFCKVERVI